MLDVWGGCTISYVWWCNTYLFCRLYVFIYRVIIVLLFVACLFIFRVYIVAFIYILNLSVYLYLFLHMFNSNIIIIYIFSFILVCVCIIACFFFFICCVVGWCCKPAFVCFAGGGRGECWRARAGAKKKRHNVAHSRINKLCVLPKGIMKVNSYFSHLANSHNNYQQCTYVDLYIYIDLCLYIV